MVSRMFIFIVYLLYLVAYSCSAAGVEDAQECANASEVATGTCSSKPASLDDGMDPMPARMQVIQGLIPAPSLCGDWCDSPSTPCTIDTAIVPCLGDFGCTTTCGLWTLFTSDSTTKPIATCQQFTFFVGYTNKATLCDESCLLPEIRKERYPLPTGLGLFCETGTCHPFIASQNPNAPVHLSCPCNWFGSDCVDDWVPVKDLVATHAYGDLIRISLTVDAELSTIVGSHQPGGVVRLVQRDPDNPSIVAEQPYALAYYEASTEDSNMTRLEILTAPPDTVNLAPHPRAVAERVRSIAKASSRKEGEDFLPLDNLYVNPSVGGFFNPHYTYLMNFLETSPETDRLVVVATGAGLSGALSAIEMTSLQHNHLYYGLRNTEETPYREKLEELVTEQSLDLVLVESRSDGRKDPTEPGILGSVMRGRKLQDRSAEKLYAHHSLGVDIESGSLVGLDLHKTIFVVCGRIELLSETLDVLEKTVCTEEGGDECKSLLSTRYFKNI